MLHLRVIVPADESAEIVDHLRDAVGVTHLVVSPGAAIEPAGDLVQADVARWQPDAPFDAVLLDAPCTATGTIRRHPDVPHLKRPKDVPALAAQQKALLDAAARLVKPGGRLVFSTCSLLPDEGEAQLTAALARHPGLAVEPPDAARLGIAPDWVTAQGGLRLRPDCWAERGGMDGFFMARLHWSGRRS